MLVRDILKLAVTQLNDFDGDRWPLDAPGETYPGASLLDLLNESLRRFTALRPQGATKTREVQLAAGARQDVPAEAVRLMRVTRNLGPDKVPGRVVYETAMRALDAHLPGWSRAKSKLEVSDWCPDPDHENAFWVYPPAPDSPRLWVEAELAIAPKVSGPGEVLPVAEHYSAAILDCLLYLAFSDDMESAASSSRASHHYGLFLKLMGVKTGADASVE